MQTVSTAPLIFRQPRPVRGNTMFVGDAAAFIDPFVGDGVSIALRSGQLAAQCVHRFLNGDMNLNEAAAAYCREYVAQFAPLYAAASRVRLLLSLPLLAQILAFEVLRFPGLVPLMIRKTRRAG